MAKRKTTKVVRGVRVVTNPKFTRDEHTPMPVSVVAERIEIENRLRRLLETTLLAGIAIGRARATASGKKAGKR